MFTKQLQQFRGETTSSASRIERQINELNQGNTASNIYGKKMDMIMVTSISDGNNSNKEIELASVEIKPAGVFTETEQVQLNKNIRVNNKSILNNMNMHMGNYKPKQFYTLGMDIIGKNFTNM